MAEHKMNKVYKVDSLEKLEYLLNTLHERGAKWSSGDELNDKEKMTRIWNEYSVNNIFWHCGLIIYNENGSVLFDEAKGLKKSIESYAKDGQAYTIIEDVKLPKPKEKPKASEAQQAQPHQPNVIQPGHYNQGDMDLFEIFYHQYPFNEFRTGMRMIAARYYHRYPDKNGLQDYDKGDEVMRRLREYEERESNE